MHKRKTLAQFLAALVVVPLLVLLPAGVAQADAVPSTQYAPVSLSDMPEASSVVTDPSGGVTVGCSSTNSPVFKSFDSSGSAVQSKPSAANTYSSFCAGNSVVGKDGTVYVGHTTYSGYNPSGQYIQAWKNNSLVWQYEIPCGVYSGTKMMAMGADGNLYVSIWQGSSPCYGNQLIGLTPTAQSGTNPAAPQVVMSHPVYAGSVVAQGVTAYNDGLVLYTSGGVQYAPYSGAWPDAIAVSNVASNYVGTGLHWFEPTTSGRVFIPIAANAAQSTGCSNPSSVTGGVKAVDPSAQDGVAWTIMLSPCMYVEEIHPSPNNGFVMRFSYTPATGGNPVEKLAAYDGTGTLLWTRAILDVSAVGGYAIAVDLNGNVAIRSDIAPYYSVSGSSYRFPEIGFMLIDGFSGATLRQLALRGEHDTTSGPSYRWGNGSEVSIGNGTFYATAYECSTLNSCNTSTTKLYAFSVPGLAMDYPRGAILGIGSGPRKQYAALGDSFSAGQGVPPFSDTSGCNRSTQAYPALFDQGINDYDLVIPPSLDGFVACSGAKTSHVLGGQNGEPAQVSVLSSDTKLVTLTVGGNDIDFADFVTQCLFADCAAVEQDYLDKIATLGASLDQVYNTILTDAPNAQVYVFGYPELLPSSQGCTYVQGQQSLEWMLEVANALNTAQLLDAKAFLKSHGMTNEQVDDVIASGGHVEFTAAEQSAAHELVVALDEKIQGTIGTVRPRLHYIDPLASGSPFAGHALCTEDQYFMGVDIHDAPYSFHPNALGQNAYRQLLLSAL